MRAPRSMVVGLVVLVVMEAGLPLARPTQGAPAAVRVDIENFAFQPQALTVPVGTTVTWTNHDAEIHTVTSPDGVFASPALETDETFSYTFGTPGTYPYFCALHPHMKSTIVVK